MWTSFSKHCASAHTHSLEKEKRLDVCHLGDAECSGKFTVNKIKITRFGGCTFLNLLWFSNNILRSQEYSYYSVLNIFIYSDSLFFCYVMWGNRISPPKLNTSTVENKSPIALCEHFKRKIKKWTSKENMWQECLAVMTESPAPPLLTIWRMGQWLEGNMVVSMPCKLMLTLPQWEKGVYVPAPPTAGGKVRLEHGNLLPRPNNCQWSDQGEKPGPQTFLTAPPNQSRKSLYLKQVVQHPANNHCGRESEATISHVQV